jgi:leucyl aminopeptidase
MIHLKSVDLKKEKVESLVIPVCEDMDVFDDKNIVSLIRKAKKIKEFKGDKDEEVTLYNLPEVKAERVIFMGLGKLEKVDMDPLRAMVGKAVKALIKKKLSDVLIAVPLVGKINMEMSSVLEAMLEGACLGNHLFDKYKKEKKRLIVSLGLL